MKGRPNTAWCLDTGMRIVVFGLRFAFDCGVWTISHLMQWLWCLDHFGHSCSVWTQMHASCGVWSTMLLRPWCLALNSVAVVFGLVLMPCCSAVHWRGALLWCTAMVHCCTCGALPCDMYKHVYAHECTCICRYLYVYVYECTWHDALLW